MELSLAHSKHYVWRAPNVGLVKLWRQTNRSNEVGNLFQSPDSSGQLRILFEPVPLLELLKELVIFLFGQ